jgi:hypothetical protein
VFHSDHTLAGSPPSGSVNELLIQGYLVVAGADIKHNLDEWAVFAGSVLTQDQIDYLYNGGAGKSYQDVIDDAG